VSLAAGGEFSMVCLLGPGGVGNCDGGLPLLRGSAFAFADGESVGVCCCCRVALNSDWFRDLRTDSACSLVDTWDFV